MPKINVPANFFNQREIKFRQKTIDGNGKKVFHYWGFMENGDFISPIQSANRTFHMAQKNSEQYTGLKDKNGKKIYEGDMVKDYDDLHDSIREVRFGETCIDASDYEQHCEFVIGFYLTNYLDNVNETEGLSSGKTRDLEIIGNIYEHSHLLNDK